LGANRERTASSPPRVYFPGAVRFPIDRREAAANPSPHEAQMDTLLRLRTPQGNEASAAREASEGLGGTAFPGSESKLSRRGRIPATSNNEVAGAGTSHTAASNSSSRLNLRSTASIYPLNEPSASMSSTTSRRGTGWPVRFAASEVSATASKLLSATAAVPMTTKAVKNYSSSKSHFSKALGSNEGTLFHEKSRNEKDYYTFLNTR